MGERTQAIEMADWTRRRKRRVRCLARDLRVFAPLLFVAFCLIAAASAIVVAEHAPAASTFEIASR